MYSSEHGRSYYHSPTDGIYTILLLFIEYDYSCIPIVENKFWVTEQHSNSWRHEIKAHTDWLMSVKFE